AEQGSAEAREPHRLRRGAGIREHGAQVRERHAGRQRDAGAQLQRDVDRAGRHEAGPARAYAARADIAACAAVICIVARIDLAAVDRVAVAIGETGAARLNHAGPARAGLARLRGRARIAAGAAVRALAQVGFTPVGRVAVAVVEAVVAREPARANRADGRGGRRGRARITAGAAGG